MAAAARLSVGVLVALVVFAVAGVAAAAAAAPTIKEVNPNKGPAAGGTKVTITGTGFKEASTVEFGATKAAAVEFTSETSITATSPAGTGTVDITVTTEGLTSEATAADKFIYAPTVTEIKPAKGQAAGGTKVTITGTGFKEASTVEFGATKAAAVEFTSATSITATSPAGTGTVDVTVTSEGQTSEATAADKFTYAPTVTEVKPNKGPAAGGTKVTITGTGFKESSTVEFGSTKAAAVEFTSETSITATSPAGAGTVNIKVTTEGQTSAPEAADQFSYVEQPAVTAVEPPTGPTAGGISVTIKGTNLTGATAVKFGANVATFFSVMSTELIIATLPPGSSGTVDVTVTTLGGTSSTSAADAFTYLAPPVEPPPKPKEEGTPPPPPAANCTLKPIFLTIERKRKGKAKPRIAGGTLRVTVTCDQDASVSLAGRLAMVVGKKPKHGKQRTKVYALGPNTAKVGKSVASPVMLKLPLATLVALVAKTRESVKITLTATNAGGVSHNAVSIKQLRA